MAPEGIVDASEAGCVEPRFSAHKPLQRNCWLCKFLQTRHDDQKTGAAMQYGGSVFVM
jgi:hypothetical protein